MKAMKTVQLSKLCDINPESITKDYPYDFIEYIDISSVSSGHLAISPQLLSISEAPSRAKRIVKNEDIIISMVRPNLRSFMFITNPKENTIVSTGFAVLRTKPGIYSGFVYYAITDRKFTEYLANNAIGTSYPAVDTDTILRGEIPYFSYDIQHKIAVILSAYDDLIENNRRRIQLLEQSARLLYREWFIYLRFPGHEHVRIIDGVPEGWEKETITSLGQVITGKTPLTKEEDNYGSEIPFIKTPDMHDMPIVIETEQSLSEKGANSQVNKFIPKGSIMVSCIGTVGVVSLNGCRAQTNQQINTVIPRKDCLRYYSYFAISDLKSKLEAMGGGATMPNINKTKFESLQVVVPSDSVLNIFDDFCQQVFKQIQNLLEQDRKLKGARDILLPRLMNGVITV
jgi:type I restriction enzyme S subunit